MKKQVEHFYQHYKVHLICWSIFISYEILVIGVLSGGFSSFLDYFIHYTFNILLFYCHAKLVLPFALQKSKLRFWLAPLLVVCEILAYIFIIHGAEILATQYFQAKMQRPVGFDYLFILRAAWRAVYFMSFATGYYYLENYLQERRFKEEVERQQLHQIIEIQNLQHELVKSQHAFLKAQINPHFLFNTLNYVYNSVRKTSTQAADTIMSLSQMMRYALESGETGPETSLLEEIEHVEHLIHIHQIRQNHQLQVQLSYGHNLQGIRLIPLILITLVENLMKHGNLSQAEKPALIRIAYEIDTLTITTANLALTDSPSGHRIGLDNIQRRLYQTYKERVHFQAYRDEQGYFHTVLHISHPTGASSSVNENFVGEKLPV